MIKFTSKIGTVTFLFFAFMISLDICMAMIWGVFGTWIPFAVVSAINLIFVLPVFFGTYYYLDEDNLRITCLWFCINKKIAYEDIVVAVPKQKMGLFPALSSDGIEIVFLKNGKTKQTFVSPAMFETFLNQLTDNIMVTNVMKAEKATTSPETKQYLLKKQEMEEQKALNSIKQDPKKQTTKKVSKKTSTKPPQKKQTAKSSSKTKNLDSKKTSGKKVTKKLATKSKK